MRIDRFTTSLQTALADAQSLALGKDHQYIEAVHLLSALLKQQGGSAKPLLSQAGANVPVLEQSIAAALERMPTVQGAGGDVHISPALARIFNVTDKLSQQRKDSYISSELVLLAMLESNDEAAKLLADSGVKKAHSMLRLIKCVAVNPSMMPRRKSRAKPWINTLSI